MSITVLPTIHPPTSDPDKLAEMGVYANGPRCQRCSALGSDRNPIMGTQRKVWNPFDPNRLSRQFDFICARCREEMAR